MPSPVIDENESQPHAFIAHQQTVDLFLLALLSTHPDPDQVMRQFRELAEFITCADSQSRGDDSFVPAIRRSAARFDRMVQRVMPALEARLTGKNPVSPSRDDLKALSLQGNQPQHE